VLSALLAMHLAAGAVALGLGSKLGHRAFAVAALAPVATVGFALSQASDVLSGSPVMTSSPWVPTLGLTLDLRLDAFALLMVALVSGVGTVVFGYAWHYFAGSRRAGRAAGLLVLFSGAMLGVVLADNVLALYGFWELTSITSFLLIGLDDRDGGSRGAAMHALLVTGAGALAMLGGLVILGHEAGTFRLSEILASPPSGTAVSAAVVLVLIGAFAKSAQYPFHSWLPGAMVAPTPISAYLHSAAMVKAGVYLIARLAPAFASVPVWRPLVVTVGLVTMIAGGLRALRPWDLKQLLAFGTISQLGFMTVLVGIGLPEATVAGCALLVAHALFKATLFMVVGIVDHGLHTRDIRSVPRLGAAWRPTQLTGLVAAASMAAVPPMAGFVAKESAYGALVQGSPGQRLVLGAIVAGSVLTVAYSARIAAALVRPDLLVPAGQNLSGDDGPPVGAVRTDHAPGIGFLAFPAVLAVLTLGIGLVSAPWSRLVDGAARSLDERAHAHLVVWHGFTPALALSVLTLAGGVGLFVARGRVARVQRRFAVGFTGTDGYDAVVRGVLAGAARVTSIVQSGSLPVYLLVIVTTLVVAPTVALVSGGWPGTAALTATPAEIPVAGLLVGAGVAATLSKRRFGAALLLGLTGYAMALLFVVLGAPDLALTQVACETLSVVVFLLVLRMLPERFERSTPAVRVVPRLVLSVAVGLFCVGLTVAAAGSRTANPVSDEMVDRARPDGHGNNVVNVVLVDIRGMDTLGEVTVLVTAGIGVAALARAGRRPPPRRPWTAGHPDGLPRAGRRRRTESVPDVDGVSS